VDDPWRDVQPIGERANESKAPAQPEQFRTISQDEKRRRGRRTHAERAGRGETTTTTKKPRRFSRRPLRVRELIEMTSELARRFHDGAVDPDTKPHEAKHFGVGYGVMVDKLNALEGRPTEILGVTDELRPVAHDLAGKLALVRKAKGAA
jgi:hypothetical protein